MVLDDTPGRPYPLFSSPYFSLLCPFPCTPLHIRVGSFGPLLIPHLLTMSPHFSPSRHPLWLIPCTPPMCSSPELIPTVLIPCAHPPVLIPCTHPPPTQHTRADPNLVAAVDVITDSKKAVFLILAPGGSANPAVADSVCASLGGAYLGVLSDTDLDRAARNLATLYLWVSAGVVVVGMHT